MAPGPGAVSRAAGSRAPAGTGRTTATVTARRRMRLAVAGSGLVAALLLTACSSDGDSGDDAGSDATPSVTATAGSGGGTGGSGAPDGSGDASGAPAGELEGSWLATTGGKAVALVVTGEQAGLFATGGTVCSGTARQADGSHTVSLDCGDGNDDRAQGTVDSVTGSTLKITWDGPLGTETYTKAEGGSLPTGLPTEGLGS
ncbi:hypothetical protein [Streptomyces sp. enrichment culture]|uniref:hypothetical protein n=1 Tax=Streptomyces sp. enrichment culture TaxID=1795815 RepID=UPI003F551CA2